MRRLVAISAKSVVAVGLLLTGTIYLAAEARQLVARQVIPSPNTAFDSAKAGELSSAKAGARTAGSNSQQLDDERAAEQQAAQLPAQKPAETPAQETHIRQIVISIPDRQLALLEDGELVKMYPVAVGAKVSPSPAGDFTIINHAVNPTYRHDGKEIGPGKGNPLGNRWMGLSRKGYGIHGTNVQSSVGKAASHGCFRMKKKDVQDLYGRVQVGDQVTIRGERDELTTRLFTPPADATVVAANSKPETEVASAAAITATTPDEK
jgi:lipoprotein-anchoring transpeptidase ErfK/SrfK